MKLVFLVPRSADRDFKFCVDSGVHGLEHRQVEHTYLVTKRRCWRFESVAAYRVSRGGSGKVSNAQR